MEIWGVLIVVGFVAFALLGEIRRVQRALEESIRAHHHTISKIPELERQIRALEKKL